MLHLNPDLLKPSGFDASLYVYNPSSQRLFKYTLSRKSIAEIARENSLRLPSFYNNDCAITNTLRKLSLCESSTPTEQTESMILYLLTCFLHKSKQGKQFIEQQEDKVLDAVIILYPRLSDVDMGFYQFCTFKSTTAPNEQHEERLKSIIKENMKGFHDAGQQRRFLNIPSWVYSMR